MSGSRRSPPSSDGSSAALKPPGWASIEGLVCGFGDRRHTAPSGTVLLETQVHGTAVVDADAAVARDPGDGFPRLAVEADALVAARPGRSVGVRTADCVPVLLVAPAARWAAAVHAGWRGTLAGIVVEAVAAARRAGVQASDLLAALGPSIGPCCYEVSVELGERFAAAGLHARASSPGSGKDGGGPHLDLRTANRLLLEKSGLPPESIQEVGPCTKCARERYHSFRAEPESAGRQISWIGWRA